MCVFIYSELMVKVDINHLLSFPFFDVRLLKLNAFKTSKKHQSKSWSCCTIFLSLNLAEKKQKNLPACSFQKFIERKYIRLIRRIEIKNKNSEEWKPTWTGCCCSIRHFWGYVINRFTARLPYLTSPACSSFSHWCRTCRLPDNVTLEMDGVNLKWTGTVLSGGHLVTI